MARKAIRNTRRSRRTVKKNHSPSPLHEVIKANANVKPLQVIKRIRDKSERHGRKKNPQPTRSPKAIDDAAPGVVFRLLYKPKLNAFAEIITHNTSIYFECHSSSQSTSSNSISLPNSSTTATTTATTTTTTASSTTTTTMNSISPGLMTN